MSVQRRQMLTDRPTPLAQLTERSPVVSQVIFRDIFLLRTVGYSACNLTENVTSLMDVHFPINLAYLSQFFDESQLINITADRLSNHPVTIRIPDLSNADKFLD